VPLDTAGRVQHGRGPRVYQRPPVTTPATTSHPARLVPAPGSPRTTTSRPPATGCIPSPAGVHCPANGPVNVAGGPAAVAAGGPGEQRHGQGDCRTAGQDPRAMRLRPAVHHVPSIRSAPGSLYLFPPATRVSAGSWPMARYGSASVRMAARRASRRRPGSERERMPARMRASTGRCGPPTGAASLCWSPLLPSR
jgi:hypothetical protein